MFRYEPLCLRERGQHGAARLTVWGGYKMTSVKWMWISEAKWRAINVAGAWKVEWKSIKSGRKCFSALRLQREPNVKYWLLVTCVGPALFFLPLWTDGRWNAGTIRTSGSHSYGCQNLRLAAHLSQSGDTLLHVSSNLWWYTKTFPWGNRLQVRLPVKQILQQRWLSGNFHHTHKHNIHTQLQMWFASSEQTRSHQSASTQLTACPSCDSQVH